MPRLSLDCLTLTDTAPADMIRAAGASGFDLVSLWLNPTDDLSQGAGDARERRRMRSAPWPIPGSGSARSKRSS